MTGTHDSLVPLFHCLAFAKFPFHFFISLFSFTHPPSQPVGQRKKALTLLSVPLPVLILPFWSGGGLFWDSRNVVYAKREVQGEGIKENTGRYAGKREHGPDRPMERRQLRKKVIDNVMQYRKKKIERMSQTENENKIEKIEGGGNEGEKGKGITRLRQP